MLYTLKNKEIELTDEEVNEIIKQNQEVEKEESTEIIISVLIAIITAVLTTLGVLLM